MFRPLHTASSESHRREDRPQPSCNQNSCVLNLLLFVFELFERLVYQSLRLLSEGLYMHMTFSYTCS